MAHPDQIEFIGFVRAIFPRYFRGAKVLEIGSLDINGTVRDAFADCRYTGIDIGPGPGVDIVCEGQNYDAPDASYDVVISCEAMEHNPYWAETVRNMVRLSKPDGLVLMTCATLGRSKHGVATERPGDSPLTVAKGWNYYRNLSAGDFLKAGVLAPLSFSQFITSFNEFDLYFAGSKSPVHRGKEREIAALREVYRRRNYFTRRGLKRAWRVVRRTLTGRARPG